MLLVISLARYGGDVFTGFSARDAGTHITILDSLRVQTRAVIRDEKVHQIYSLMQAGKKHGMQTMNDALQMLYMNNEVTLEEALKRSGDRNELLRAVGEPVPGE